MQVGLVGQQGNPRAVSLVGDIVDRLQADGVGVVVDEVTHEAFEYDAWTENGDGESSASAPEAADVDRLAHCDLAVSVGGDGTFLYTARGAGATPIMGVNLGEVGFLNAVPPDAAVEAVTTEVDHIRETGGARTQQMHRLRAEADPWTLPPALNEVVVQGPQRGHDRGVDIEVRVDGSLYTSGHADGVLVATATGSTAYNLSEGGPIVHPEVGGLLVTEMCGRDAMPSLVAGVDAEIVIRVRGTDRVVAVGDGRVQRDLTPPAEVRLTRADAPVNVAGPPLDFFAALNKLE
jgi:NAD+ kinase